MDAKTGASSSRGPVFAPRILDGAAAFGAARLFPVGLARVAVGAAVAALFAGARFCVYMIILTYTHIGGARQVARMDAKSHRPRGRREGNPLCFRKRVARGKLSALRRDRVELVNRRAGKEPHHRTGLQAIDAIA